MIQLLQGHNTFQWYQDNAQHKNPPRPGMLHGTLLEHETALRELNKRGAAIHFSVNQTDGKGRRTENITQIRAYFIELDNAANHRSKHQKILELYNSPIPPSAIIESKNGLHVYWYATPGHNLDPIAYRDVNRRLTDYFGGDPHASDIARVLRVPTFLHQKDPGDPFAIKIISENPDNTYTREQITNVFPPTQEELETKARLARAQREAKNAAEKADEAPADSTRQQRRMHGWVRTAVNAECDAVANHAPGGRNHRLNTAAYNLGRLIHLEVFSEEELSSMLEVAAQQAGLGQHETRQTIHSGMTAGQQNPRHLTLD